MVDLRPDLHSYSRVAYLRWLKGDVDGALEVMQMAAHAASPLDAESAAWVYAHLAVYQLQRGDAAGAGRSIAAALEFQKNYPPALLLRGRILLAEGKNAEAANALMLAAQLNPLPEYQWALADALRADGRAGEAEVVET
jgi:tetratricopeptide (TPR) repeat protein